MKLLGRNANELGANKNSSKPPITESMQITALRVRSRRAPSKNSEPDTRAGVGRVSVSFLEPLTRTLEMLVNDPFAISVAIIVNVDHRC